MKIFSLLLMQCFIAQAYSQSNPAVIFVKHDTAVLKSTECEWVVKSLTRNDPVLRTKIGKSVPEFFIDAISSGKLVATDIETNKRILPKQIKKWKMPVDSIQRYDPEGNVIGYLAVQADLNYDKLSQLRIYQDWYMNITTGKISSVISRIDLMLETYTQTGLYLGYQIFCRVYY